MSTAAKSLPGKSSWGMTPRFPNPDGFSSACWRRTHPITNQHALQTSNRRSHRPSVLEGPRPDFQRGPDPARRPSMERPRDSSIRSARRPPKTYLPSALHCCGAPTRSLGARQLNSWKPHHHPVRLYRCGHAGVENNLENAMDRNGPFHGTSVGRFAHGSETLECAGRTRPDCPKPVVAAVVFRAAFATR